MTSPAAIQACYADYRRVKGRKCLQIILEVPLEQAPMVHEAFGEPLPDGSTWVAVARIDPNAKPERKGGKLAQRAGILCNEQAFWEFLGSNIARKILPRIYENIDHEDQAALAVRDICGVSSRAQLDHEHIAGQRFTELELTYRAWLTVDT